MTMTSVQTSVAQTAVIGVPGDEYDSEPKGIVSKRAAEDIPFGVWVSFTAEDTCELPDTSGEVTGIHGGGIALRDQNLPTTQGYKAGDMVRVCTRGRVFVRAEEAVLNTDTPFTRHAAGGGGSQLGSFRNDADTASAATPPGTRFFKGGSVTQPPVLEIK